MSGGRKPRAFNIDKIIGRQKLGSRFLRSGCGSLSRTIALVIQRRRHRICETALAWAPRHQTAAIASLNAEANASCEGFRRGAGARHRQQAGFRRNANCHCERTRRDDSSDGKSVGRAIAHASELKKWRRGAVSSGRGRRKK